MIIFDIYTNMRTNRKCSNYQRKFRKIQTYLPTGWARGSVTRWLCMTSIANNIGLHVKRLVRVHRIEIYQVNLIQIRDIARYIFICYSQKYHLFSIIITYQGLDIFISQYPGIYDRFHDTNSLHMASHWFIRNHWSRSNVTK